MLEAFLRIDVWWILGVTSVVVGLFLFLALSQRKQSERVKWILFLGLTFPILISTLYLIVSTVYQNLASISKGPVHWHADFLIRACGEEIRLKQPSGLSNYIGTPLFHEHGDRRLHVEGKPQSFEDITLRAFLQAIGGDLTESSLAIPVDSDLRILSNGQTCRDGSRGTLQVFVYRVKNGRARQEKLSHAPVYILSPHTLVPPGDCIIFEFGPPRTRTDLVCPSYRLAEQRGELVI